jgi:amino acid adenylation domain-containing protein
MMLVHDLLAETAARSPERTAIVAGDRTVTFAGLDAASARLAAALQGAGVRRGDRVAAALDNSIEFVLALFGTLRAGGVFVPVNPTTKAQKLGYLLDDCEVRAVVAGGPALAAAATAAASAASVVAFFQAGGTAAAPIRPGLEARPLEDALDPAGTLPQVPADPGLIDQDLAAILYTSGSTGQPKGVMLTHANMRNTSWSISTYLGLRAEDVVACVLPLSFDYGLFQVLMGARVGFTLLLERGFTYPHEVLARMRAEGVTCLPGVPSIFARLLEAPGFRAEALPRLRLVTNTAAAFAPAHIRRIQALFPEAQVFSMYGLTECTRVCFLPPERLADKVASVGRAMPNCETMVVDEAGRPLPPGEVGELVVRGANVMRGYWGKPEATARRLREGPIPGERLLHTGDLFRTDEEGFLYFVGRRDDVFKCRGEKVSPKEIEFVLHELDGVAEAAVVGVDDPLDGTAVKAVVVARAGHRISEQEVRRHCRAHLESHLVPRFVEVVEALPTSENGKVRKRDLASAAE